MAKTQGGEYRIKSGHKMRLSSEICIRSIQCPHFIVYNLGSTIWCGKQFTVHNTPSSWCGNNFERVDNLKYF